MADDYEAYFVEDIIVLLGKAKLVAGSANLERAAKLCDPQTETTTRPCESYGDNTWLAINKLRLELERGMTEGHALPLWHAAVESANTWLSALKRTQ